MINPPPIKDGWANDIKAGPRPSWALWFNNVWFAITGEIYGLQNVANGLTSQAVVFSVPLTASPKKITATPLFNSGAFFVSAVSAAGFTINWTTATSGTQQWSWSAKV